jgi:hypothetical protein
VRRSLGFCLQNAWDREVQQIQVQGIWRPIRRKSEFCSSHWVVLVVGHCRICRKAYFLSDYVPLDPGDHMVSQKLLVDASVDTFAGKNHYRRHKSTAFFIMYFGNLLQPPPPLCELARPAEWGFVYMVMTGQQNKEYFIVLRYYDS